ncbi:alpha/beta fold hydrolase [Bathymodiolus septemdierum thioautotrophic gill symbiont]|uniref:Pimelyl-[acyl-carrier protein] methyl ester esterase n=1 Tax=endosymbiont of Bathymodiolus septemdierum str. Myojin knoll TaxID=1303921 RepID=A0A0P0USY0_9GAMM|nr:alpha/beta fold hydrolase [Bathymodiolus septemdierum thioautotrophic gill symbiont]BAS68208.1 pimelyl-[acyl-carrier protein] methyl ester esterase [endosymbiont of Bathymodiolus septemdierum str. Myojin knoll]
MLYSRTTGTGKDLVLLHGWGFNSDLFNDLIARYQNQYQITVIDLPGHGRSSVVDGDLDKWCDEIIKLLPDNPILLGWSLGGLLAINIANKVNVSQLILLASSPNFVTTVGWHYGIDAKNFHQFSDTLSLNLSKGLKRFVSLQSQNKTQLKSLNQSIDTLPATTIALNQGLKILLQRDLRQQFEQLDIPIQVVLGKQDTLIPIEIAKWYKQKNTSVTILNTGHLPFLHPDFELRII